MLPWEEPRALRAAGLGRVRTPGQKPVWAPSGGDFDSGRCPASAPMPGSAGNEAEEPVGALRRPEPRISARGGSQASDPGILRLDV